MLLDLETMAHWFLLPITYCGILVGIDAVNWMRGRLDFMSPRGLFGAFGFNLFFFSPLLHVFWGYQMAYLPPIQDWRPWLGWMAILNAIGLSIYKSIISFYLIKIMPKKSTRRNFVEWSINWENFPKILFSSMLITMLAQIVIYIKFGGILGYINSFEESIGGNSSESNFQGLGALFAISESFPILLMIGYAAVAPYRPKWQTWPMIILVFIIFFIVRIFFGGLRGSRSNTLYAMIWGAGIVHLYVRKIPMKLVGFGILLAMIFLFTFGVYKNFGSKTLEVLTAANVFDILDQQNRSMSDLLISDLGRADIQGYVLHNLMDPTINYHYGYGVTYLAAILEPIPDTIFPVSIPNKITLGSDALYGTQWIDPRNSSRIFGLSGEAMLNFGPLAVPFTFAILGFIVVFVDRLRYRLSANDSRYLLLPMLILVSGILFVYHDMDLIMIILIKQLLVPFLVIKYGSSVKPRLQIKK
ncbi:hypothetical protein TI04_01240 [Achromatium sp. WMS2]|nr:hypothetical protein TI04_01240 [Achromatium sp. WMS2]